MYKNHRLVRFIAVLTALAISFSGMVLFDSVHAYAESPLIKEYYDEALIEELSVIEPVKENYGMKGVDFCELYTSEKIPVYEYTKSGIEKAGQVLPVYYHGQMKLIMFEVENNKYQAVAIPINISVDNDSLAILYDDSGCYFYNGQSTVQVFHSNIILDSRKHISSLSSTDKQQIILANLKEKRRIHYSIELSRLQTYYILGVYYIHQSTNNLCWAAASAMIINYKKNYNNNNSLSDVDVAKSYWGNDYNRGLNPKYVDDALNNYNLNYHYHGLSASMDRIYTNINNHNPIYGCFYFMDGSNARHHAAVIYGYSVMAGKIYLIDPEYGYITSQITSSQFTYVRPDKNLTMIMQNTVSKNW